MTGKVPKKKIINLLTNETKIILDEKDANTCYNLSLQTCQDIARNSKRLIDHISFIEFMELIGRVADVFLNELEEPLSQKINYVLDEWLRLVDEFRQPIVEYLKEKLEDSDSEKDYIAKNRIHRIRMTTMK